MIENLVCSELLSGTKPDRQANPLAEASVGTGYSGRRAMGVKGPVKWAYMESYIRAFRGLLRGETVEWEGARMRMLHPETHAPPRPVDVPVLIAAQGPKGHAVAKDLADGLFAVAAVPEFAREVEWVAYLAWGTVLDED